MDEDLIAYNVSKSTTFRAGTADIVRQITEIVREEGNYDENLEPVIVISIFKRALELAYLG